MFASKSPEGTYCQVCDKQPVIDVYFCGDDLEDAVKRYNPDIRLCKDHLQELYRVLPPIAKEIELKLEKIEGEKSSVLETRVGEGDQ